MVIALVVSLVAIAICLPVGLMVLSKLESLTKISGMSATANSTVDTVNTNTYSAFSLAAIIPIVAGAALVIAVIVGAFAVTTQRQ
jgi:hypothetical protein